MVYLKTTNLNSSGDIEVNDPNITSPMNRTGCLTNTSNRAVKLHDPNLLSDAAPKPPFGLSATAASKLTLLQMSTPMLHDDSHPDKQVVAKSLCTSRFK